MPLLDQCNGRNDCGDNSDKMGSKCPGMVKTGQYLLCLSCPKVPFLITARHTAEHIGPSAVWPLS